MRSNYANIFPLWKKCLPLKIKMGYDCLCQDQEGSIQNQENSITYAEAVLNFVSIPVSFKLGVPFPSDWTFRAFWWDFWAIAFSQIYRIVKNSYFTHFMSSTNDTHRKLTGRMKIKENWRPQRDSNPRRRRERPVSWARLDDGDKQFSHSKRKKWAAKGSNLRPLD